MSIISKLAKLGEKNNIAITLAYDKGEVTATVAVKPKKGDDEPSITPVQIRGPIEEVEKSIESDLEKLTTRLLQHSTTMDELDKQLKEEEDKKKAKVTAKKSEPAAASPSGKKLTKAEKKAAKQAAKAADKKDEKAADEDKGEKPTSAQPATALLDDL